MDIASLRYFVAVAEERSVGKAALRLHMAQPPLSVKIRNMETRLGTALFRRTHGGMELTDAGSALLERARNAIALADEGFQVARAVGAGRQGRLSIGYMFALGYAMLPGLIPALRSAMPNVELHFTGLTTATREALINDHKVGLALCMPPLYAPGITTTVVGTQPLRLVLPRSSPLARLKAVPVGRLQGCKLIGVPTYVEGSESSIVASLLRRHGVTMQLAHRAETAQSALALVLAGEGLTFLPACAAIGAPPGLVLRPLEGADEGIDVAVCRRADLNSPLIEPFIACARAALAA